MDHKHGKGDADHTNFIEAHAFAQNFLLRFSTQEPCRAPVKPTNEGLTAYFSVAFVMLPDNVMIPRPSDQRVGYFTTPLRVGGPKQATTVQYVINRWNLQRHDCLLYVIDSSVPCVYHDTIKKGVLTWNSTFQSACGRDVLKCVAPGDHEYPSDYALGDGRHIAISMTNPSQKGLLGYGPSAVDYRSGEILMASVMLGFQSHVEHASRFSDDLLLRPSAKCAGCPCLLDADDPDVMRDLLLTTIHEVGHTLGLRHNFIAAEDGHSSVMDYIDELDTTDPGQPIFGGHFLQGPGRYDLYAIRYGYTELAGEERGERHRSLDLLANGQSQDDQELSETPLNPLFASDEDINGIDPRVQRHGAGVSKMGADKIQWALERRVMLLKHVQAGQIDCDIYSRQLLGSLQIATKAVACASGFVGGALVDAQRVGAVPCDREVGFRYVAVVLNVIIGPLFRLNDDDVQHMLKREEGTYGLQAVSVLTLHANSCEILLSRLLDPCSLAKLEAQRASCTDPKRQPMSVWEVLTALFFGPDQARLSSEQVESKPVGRGINDYQVGLLHPLQPGQKVEASHCKELDAACTDAFASQARLVAARLVNVLMRRKSVHAVVQAQATAVVRSIEGAMEGLDGLDVSLVTKEHWRSLLDILKQKRREQSTADDES